MKDINVKDLEFVSGGIYEGASPECLFWSSVAAVSPLGGPFAVVTSFGAAGFACADDGSDYGDGCDYS